MAFLVGFCPRSSGSVSVSPAQDSVQAIVLHAYDGDTIKVRLASGEEKRVRLIGVDSPEYNDPQEKGRLLAFFAKRFTQAGLYQKAVRLAFDREKEDVYGRLLAFVWTDDATLYNEVLVRSGYAWAYLKYPFDKAMERRIREAEAEARREGRGLWREAPYPEIGPAEAFSWVGQVAAVRFRCAGSFNRSHFRVLAPPETGFEVVISKDALATFPESLDFVGRTLIVTGLVEAFRGRPQIMVGLSLQVRVVE